MQGEIAMKLYISLCDYGSCVARKMREIRAKNATRVEPDINSRVHFVGVNNFASFRFVPEEMPNWVGALDPGISDSS